MQKMLSTRLEEAPLNELERATRRLGISKRQFLEEAIQLRAEQMSRDDGGDVWSETLGAWRRFGVLSVLSGDVSLLPGNRDAAN